MTCYVDTVREYPDAGLRFSAYCHLLADTRGELHAMAAGLGMPRRAFQDHAWRWHYDLPGEFRAAAVAAGAVEVDFHRVGLLLRERRAAAAAPGSASGSASASAAASVLGGRTP